MVAFLFLNGKTISLFFPSSFNLFFSILLSLGSIDFDVDNVLYQSVTRRKYRREKSNELVDDIYRVTIIHIRDWSIHQVWHAYK